MMLSQMSSNINAETFASSFANNPNLQMGGEEDQALFMAVNLGSLAIEADRNSNYEEALCLYTRSVSYLQKVQTETRICYDELLNERCQQYIRRVETLRCYLESNSQFYNAAVVNEGYSATFSTTVAKILLMERFCGNCRRCVADSPSDGNGGCPSCNVAIEGGTQNIENPAAVPSAPPEKRELPLRDCGLRQQEVTVANHFPSMVDIMDIGDPEQKLCLFVFNFISQLFD